MRPSPTSSWVLATVSDNFSDMSLYKAKETRTAADDLKDEAVANVVLGARHCEFHLALALVARAFR